MGIVIPFISKPASSQNSKPASSGGGILGLGGGKKFSAAAFIEKAKRNGLEEAQDLGKVIRLVDFAKDRTLREQFKAITTSGNVVFKNAKGEIIDRHKIKKGEMLDLAQRSTRSGGAIIGKSIRRNQALIKRNHGFEYRDKDGKVVKVDLSGSTNLIDARKVLGQAIISARKSGVRVRTPEEIKRMVRASEASRSFGGGGYKTEKQKVKDKFENTNSGRITDKKIDYKVGVGTAQQSTADVRHPGAGIAADDYGKDVGFGMNTKNATGLASGTGAKNQEKASNAGGAKVSTGGGNHISFGNFSGESAIVGSSLDGKKTPDIRIQEGKRRIFNMTDYRKTSLLNNHELGNEAGSADGFQENNIPERNRREIPTVMPEDTLELFNQGNGQSADDYDLKRVA